MAITAKYTGPTQHTRVITAKEFNRVEGIDGVEKDHVWGPVNNWTTDVSDLPAAALEVLKADKSFKISETEDKPEQPAGEDSSAGSAKQKTAAR